MLFSNLRYLCFFSILFLVLQSCTKNSDTNFKVEGKLDNLSATQLYAVREISGDSIVIDTIVVNKSGEFTYKGKVEGPTLVDLFCGEGKAHITFFLEPGYSVKLKANVADFGLAELKGGRVNDDLMSFKTENQNLLQARSRILSKQKNLDPAELKNVNFQLARCVREYVGNNPTKMASVVLMDDYSINNVSPELLGNDIELLKGEAADFYLTTALRSFYERVKKSEVGAVAPDFTLKSSKGDDVSLKDFRGKGKDVLLMFDLKSTPQNIKYFEMLKGAQKELKDKVIFLTIVIDVDARYPEPEIVDIANSLDWTILFDGKKWSSNIVKKYHVTSTPYMILVSPEGIIEERDVDMRSLYTRYNIKSKTNSEE